MTVSKVVPMAAASLVVAPYILLRMLGPYILPTGTSPMFHPTPDDQQEEILFAPSITPKVHPQCGSKLSSLFSDDLFDGLTMNLHRNGDPNPCSQATVLKVSDLVQAMVSFGSDCPSDKYEVEAFLTQTMAKVVGNSCGADDIKNPVYGGFLGHCDRGPERTPPLHDKDKLVRLPSSDTLPCRFYTREGVRISSLEQFADIVKNSKERTCSIDGETETCTAAEFELYAVPAGRVFMFAPRYVGETFELPHVPGGSADETISLKVLSMEPRVFDISNFFSKEESTALVNKALHETTESHRIKRSTTGTTGHHLNNQRTSESGFDTHGKVAVKIKKRCFTLLGFDEYVDGYSDGLQILRYNETTAYTTHLDYLDDPGRRLRHNYDSAGKGGNRYATILLYMSDLGEHGGGETVFVHGDPLDNSTITENEALAQLRASGDSKRLTRGSWEEKMAAKCRSKLAVRPRMARAVLFYSQHPNGEVDNKSRHGGCPVLAGTKWAANLWVWNTIRDGFPGNPINEHVVAKEKAEGKQPKTAVSYEQKSAQFSNSGTDPTMKYAKLYYRDADGDKFWGDLQAGARPLGANTYEGNQWVVKVGDRVVKSWLIGALESYNFVI